MDANSSEKLNIVNDTEPLTSTGGDGVPLKPQPAGTRPQQQHPTQQPGHSVPLTSHPEDAHFRESVQPDIQTFQAKLHAQKFRTTLAVLMVPPPCSTSHGSYNPNLNHDFHEYVGDEFGLVYV